MNKNILSLAMLSLLAAAPVSAENFLTRGISAVRNHAEDHKPAYALMALAAFNQFAKRDLQDKVKALPKKSFVHVGDKIVDLMPLACALALGTYSQHNFTKSAKGMYDLATFQSKEIDKLGAFLSNGATLFATSGAAYTVYKHIRSA